jgi:hypothetical protein
MAILPYMPELEVMCGSRRLVYSLTTVVSERQRWTMSRTTQTRPLAMGAGNSCRQKHRGLRQTGFGGDLTVRCVGSEDNYGST